jgi:hypothetical protein
MFATAKTAGYVIIGKPAPERPRPPDCMGVMYELRNGRLYCPRQIQDTWFTHTPSQCFVVRKSETSFVVQDSQDPNRILCEMSRPEPGKPSVIKWPSGRKMVWPYMTEDNSPALPARSKFFAADDQVILRVYSYRNEQGEVVTEDIPIFRY